MCGIAGYYTSNNIFYASELQAMGDVMSHRGPDAHGYYSNNTIGLVHRRLKIIDLSEAANQPMKTADGRFTIIFNGEIYNFEDLRREHQIPTTTTSDTEVILYLLAKYGVEICKEFNGMFAIAFYDELEDSLTLIRDRMGVKPLYYFWNGSDFAFASELKSLLLLSHIQKNKSINFEAVNMFLHLGYIGGEISIYSNIYKLQTGSYITIQKNTLTKNSYWSLQEKITKEKISNIYQAKEQLKDLLVSSVRYRLRCDVPFGSFLSGGIDSSLVSAIAQQNVSSSLQTFTIAFDNAKHNESSFAKNVASYLGTKHTELLVTEKDAIEIAPNILDIYDEPYCDSSAIPTLLVSKLAREHVTMALSGDGGDELFMGYGAYVWANRLQNPTISTFRKPLATALSLGNSRAKRAAQVLTYKDSKNIPSHIFSQEQGFFSRSEIQKILRKEIMCSFDLCEYPQNLARELSVAENQALFDMQYYLPEDLLTKVDRASMQHSLEIRVPILDYNVVEFALNVNENLKMQNGIQKYLLKEVLYDFIPAHLFDRPKWGFSIPLQQWLKTDLYFLIDTYLHPSKIAKHKVLDEQYVTKYIHGFMSGKKPYYYNRVWAMIVLQKFLEDNF